MDWFKGEFTGTPPYLIHLMGKWVVSSKDFPYTDLLIYYFKSVPWLKFPRKWLSWNHHWLSSGWVTNLEKHITEIPPATKQQQIGYNAKMADWWFQAPCLPKTMVWWYRIAIPRRMEKRNYYYRLPYILFLRVVSMKPPNSWVGLLSSFQFQKMHAQKDLSPNRIFTRIQGPILIKLLVNPAVSTTPEAAHVLAPIEGAKDVALAPAKVAVDICMPLHIFAGKALDGEVLIRQLARQV